MRTVHPSEFSLWGPAIRLIRMLTARARRILSHLSPGLCPPCPHRATFHRSPCDTHAGHGSKPAPHPQATSFPASAPPVRARLIPVRNTQHEPSPHAIADAGSRPVSRARLLQTFVWRVGARGLPLARVRVARWRRFPCAKPQQQRAPRTLRFLLRHPHRLGKSGRGRRPPPRSIGRRPLPRGHSRPHARTALLVLTGPRRACAIV